MGSRSWRWRGEISRRRNVFSRVHALWTPDSPKGTWYYGLWTAVTRAKLLLKQDRCDEAAALLSAAVGGAGELADPLLTAVLRLLLVEAHARAGRTAPAAQILAGTFSADWPSTLELLAEFGRVVGRALAADGAGGRRPLVVRAWRPRAGERRPSDGAREPG